MNSLLLKSKEMKITEVPEPKEVLLPLKGFDEEKEKLKIKEGSRVKTGEELIPGVYSTVTGTITGIDIMSFAGTDLTILRIAVSETDEIAPEITAAADYLEKDAAELLKKLNRANLGFDEELKDIKTVIISAVDTEPLAASYQQFLIENPDTVTEGLKLIKHLTAAGKVFLALPEPLLSSAANLTAGAADIFPVKPVYPNGLPEILTRDISRKYDTGKTAFLKIEKLVAAVLALRDGKPFSHKVITAAGKGKIKNLKVRIGTPLKDLLQDMQPGENEKVMIGGPMMGTACYNTDLPVTADVDMIYVQDAAEIVKNENNQCMNCGKCVEVCPAHLSVNLIGRYAEFSIFEQCRDLGIQHCIECGLCAYYCPSGRSLVQFIQLAKSELEKIEAEKIETEGEDVE
ncbi:MAG: 4Fe-4S dicluster domain-containing protein [Candidatus Aminicenantes bacterium]|nr:4Fe-4S dicluster domain-containing protein [Candidatus Aminicenantes bacterium]